jgi:hypothetical protein
VKQYLAAAAAGLLLASCETYPQSDPYGAPYPAEDPYGPADPPQPYPPATGYPPPDAQPAGPVGACPIASSRGGQARVDPTAGPDQRPTLIVNGTVVAPTGGYRMEFEPHLTERRSYPVQLVARLRPIPPEGPATQALTTHDIRWQWPLATGPVGSVTIACGDRTLAQISPVPVN